MREPLSGGTITVNPYQRNHLIRDAIGRALYDVMGADQSVHLFGEGASIKVHYDAPDIERDFPHRVHTLPISEDGNVNFAVGASLLGVTPVVDIITADFLYRAMDSICNTAAKLNFVLPDSEPPKTMVVRAEFLTGGPTTGQRPEALFAHIPGLNVVVPSTPLDAYGLMRTALKTPGVTLFFEDREIRDDLLKEAVRDDGGTGRVPLGQAVYTYRSSSPAQLTIVAYGLMNQVVERVLLEEHIAEADLIDLRSIYPLDLAAVGMSLARSGKLLVVEPDVVHGGVGAELVAGLIERGVSVSTCQRLGAPRETIPASPEGQRRLRPDPEQILSAIREMLR